MKITFYIGSIAGGGAERVVCELASYLSRRGHKVEILVNTTTEKNYPIGENVSVISLDNDLKMPVRQLRQLCKLFRLRRFIRKSDTDVYIVFLPKTIQYFMYFGKKLKAKVVISERCDPMAYSEKKRKMLFGNAANADGIVFQTETVRDCYAANTEKMPANVVIPNAVASEFRPYTGQRRREIVGAGRFDEQKNFPLLISAFGKIAAEFPDSTLAIYGQGSMLEKYRTLAESLGIADRVKFPGYVKDIGEKIKDAGLFVLSSDYEGMPNALMEAMALGLPCISTDCGGGGARFLIRDEENGLLIPVRDEEAMAAAMRRILSDPAFAATLSENAAKLGETLSPENVYARWENFIAGLLKES